MKRKYNNKIKVDENEKYRNVNKIKIDALNWIRKLIHLCISIKNKRENINNWFRNNRGDMTKDIKWIIVYDEQLLTIKNALFITTQHMR